MSIDYSVNCRTCKLSTHLGQRMSTTYSFGYGSKDRENQALVMEWIANHIDKGHKIELTRSDGTNYKWIELPLGGDK